MNTEIKHLLAWFVLLFCAMLNGAVRQALFIPHMSEAAAHQLSTLTLIVLIGLLAWAAHRRWPLPTVRAAYTVGAAWMLATVAFEFLFFHFVTGHSWDELLANYNIAEGRLWPLILVWTCIAPPLIHTVLERGRKRRLR